MERYWVPLLLFKKNSSVLSKAYVCPFFFSSTIFLVLPCSVPLSMQPWHHFTVASTLLQSPHLKPPVLRQFYYSVSWWCLHWQISGVGSCQGNNGTVRKPLTSTACLHRTSAKRLDFLWPCVHLDTLFDHIPVSGCPAGWTFPVCFGGQCACCSPCKL